MTLIDVVCSSRRGLKNSYELRRITPDLAAAARAVTARAATSGSGIGDESSISIASINFKERAGIGTGVHEVGRKCYGNEILGWGFSWIPSVVDACSLPLLSLARPVIPAQ